MSWVRPRSVTRSAAHRAALVLGAAALAGSLVASPQAAYAAAPANDYVNHATTVSAVPFSDTVDTRTATTGATDAVSSCDAKSAATVWYRFRPSVGGTYAFSTQGSTYDTVVNLFSGSPSALTWLACNDDFETTAAVLVSHLTAGTTYYVSAGTCCTAEPGPGPGGSLTFSVAKTHLVDVRVTVAPRARLHADQHQATFHGTITCATDATYHMVGYVKQQQASGDALGLFEIFGACTAGSTRWQAVGTSVERPWWQKKATVNGNVTACSPYVCADAAFGPVDVRMVRPGSVAAGERGLR